VTTVNIFTSVNKIVLLSLVEHFSASHSNCFESLSFDWQFAPLVSGTWPFFRINILQRSVATHLRGGWIFYYYDKFIGKSVGERILKIGQQLAKLVAK